jgi:hypothetical protein
MPRGVGRGAGWQKRPVLVSTAIKVAVGVGAGESGREDVKGEDEDGASGLHAEMHSAGEAMAIAVEIRWAMTHPTIFSREDVGEVGGRRNR